MENISKILIVLLVLAVIGLVYYMSTASSMEAEVIRLKKALEESETVIKKLNEAAAVRQAAETKLNGASVAAANTIKELQQTIAKMRQQHTAELADYMQRLEQAQSFVRVEKPSGETINANAINELTRQLAKVTAEYADLQKVKTTLDAELQKMRTDLFRATENITSLNTQLANAKQKAEKDATLVAELEKQIADIKAKGVAANSELESTYKATEARLREANTRLANDLANCKKLLDTNLSEKADLTRMKLLEQDITKLQEQLQAAMVSSEYKDLQIRNLTHHLDRVLQASALDSNTRQSKELEVALERVAEIQATLNTQNELIRTLRDERDKAVADAERQQSLTSSFFENLKALRISVADCAARALASASTTDLEKKVVTLEQENARLHKLQADTQSNLQSHWKIIADPGDARRFNYMAQLMNKSNDVFMELLIAQQGGRLNGDALRKILFDVFYNTELLVADAGMFLDNTVALYSNRSAPANLVQQLNTICGDFKRETTDAYVDKLFSGLIQHTKEKLSVIAASVSSGEMSAGAAISALDSNMIAMFNSMSDSAKKVLYETCQLHMSNTLPYHTVREEARKRWTGLPDSVYNNPANLYGGIRTYLFTQANVLRRMYMVYKNTVALALSGIMTKPHDQHINYVPDEVNRERIRKEEEERARQDEILMQQIAALRQQGMLL